MAAIPPTTSAARPPGGGSSSSSSGAVLAPALLLLLLWGDPTRALRPAASPRRLAPRHARLHAVSSRLCSALLGVARKLRCTAGSVGRHSAFRAVMVIS